ncbi:hypothetical protein 031MP004_87 [Bacillus phage 031MP004]|nr:hypothetical protein 031MP003_89 [Bacillus phage 031MP003]QFG05664.1 hypothetical protein 031MP004_87 [Bacillus phage 031MP004]
MRRKCSKKRTRWDYFDFTWIGDLINGIFRIWW